MATPLFILTPTGRTGTTLLMALLNLSPSIVLDNVYPYEIRLLQEEAMARQREEKTAESEVGSMIYYDQLANKQKKFPSYIAEKLLGLNLSPIVSAYADAKFLATLRDPRDVFLSITAFDAKRGFRGFALQDEDDLIASVKKIGGAFAELAALNLDEGKFLVRYEDLVSDPQRVLNSLTEWLEIEPFSFIDAPTHPFHRTTLVDSLSVGRWRIGMSKDVLDICHHYWKEVIIYFGYDL